MADRFPDEIGSRDPSPSHDHLSNEHHLDEPPVNEPPVNEPPPNEPPPNEPPPNEPLNPHGTRIVIPYRPRPIIDLEALASSAVLDSMINQLDFIMSVRRATLDDGVVNMSPRSIERLHHPPQEPLQIASGGIRHSITSYLVLKHASQESFQSSTRSARHNFHDSQAVKDLLSFHATEKIITKYTGVEGIEHDMCPSSCVAFTGPFEHLDRCPMCNASRWDEGKLLATGGRVKQAIRKAVTIPLGPQLQARYRNPDSARDMQYLHQRTEAILTELRETQTIPVTDDIAMGHDYLSAYLAGDIKPNDIVVSISLDGAQLYEKKQSDCWIYVWIIHNLSPDKRYRKVNVLPGGFIPGLNKPKHLDSFLFPGFHHLSALQNEGLPVWDASINAMIIVFLYLIFITADGPGLVHLDGMVGHTGKNGCRLYCGVLGRRKEQDTHYYPALLMPRDHCNERSNHDDIDVFNLPTTGQQTYATNLFHLVAAPNLRQLDLRKTETGITKPPLILGLHPSHSLGIPLSMTTDVMHLVMNLSILLISLWRGTIDVGNSDSIDSWDWAVLRTIDAWQSHGKAVENTGPYLPGSFDCKPRNIAEKLTSGYKTWEFQLHTFSLGPALLYGVLPEKYWLNYCKLVRGLQILCQHRITQADLVTAHVLLCNWEREFEEMYYQLREDRIHFVRPCVHQVVHLAKETVLKGPPICYAQWTMERTIGNLGQEIRQPSNPYGNISQEGVWRSKVNALLSAIPELAPPPLQFPAGSVD